jgi:hemerythrin-like metal-binding protein
MLTVTDELIERLDQGVKIINSQHKKIMDLTTDLFAHCLGKEEEENQYFGSIMHSAADSVKEHFQTEEDLMLAAKFDVYEFSAHKREHAEFTATVAGYISRFQKSGRIDLLTFASYAKWWVIGHIKRHDKKYVDYFNKLTEGRGAVRMQV